MYRRRKEAMNRRRFFSFLGIAAASGVVRPKTLAKAAMRPPLDRLVSARISFPSPSIGGAVYEEPLGGYDYSIGVWAGDGISSLNPSCVSILRKGEGNDPDVQVAEFVYGRMAPAEFTLAVADWAKSYGEKCKDRRGPLFVIEQVAAPGDLVQAQLKILGFTRFHRAVKCIPNKLQTIREGWYSSTYSLPIIMTRFRNAVDEGCYKPNSSNLKLCFGKSEKEQRHDPVFMAAAQSYVDLHTMGDRGE
jgi:hypothetical protein